MKKIDVKSLQDNVFSLIGDRWMLITAGTAERCNTMTASWGGLGVLWGAPAATIYLRPQRYTKEFVDREEYFTLAFFGEEQRKALTLCGSKSGREVDKVKECGFTVAQAECGAPYFEEAELVLERLDSGDAYLRWRGGRWLYDLLEIGFLQLEMAKPEAISVKIEKK